MFDQASFAETENNKSFSDYLSKPMTTKQGDRLIQD